MKAKSTVETTDNVSMVLLSNNYFNCKKSRLIATL